jgi:hypothetical protein
VRGLEGGLGEQDTVVGDDPDGVAVDAGETRDDRGAVLGLELVQLAAVDDAGDDLADVVGLARVDRHDGAQVLDGVERVDRLGHGPGRRASRGEGAHDVADEVQRVDVVVREMVRHAADGGSAALRHRAPPR